MFGINGGEAIVLVLVALVVIGPERLPRYAEQLGAWVRAAREYARTAKARVDAELGEHVGDVDWQSLDPRRYDPRRIVREALWDDPDEGPATGRSGQGDLAPGARSRSVAPGGAAAGVAATGIAAGRTTAGAATPTVVRAPYDDEAT